MRMGEVGEEEGALLSEEEAWADDSVDEDALEDAPIAMQVGCYLTSINKKRLYCKTTIFFRAYKLYTSGMILSRVCDSKDIHSL